MIEIAAITSALILAYIQNASTIHIKNLKYQNFTVNITSEFLSFMKIFDDSWEKFLSHMLRNNFY